MTKIEKLAIEYADTEYPPTQTEEDSINTIAFLAYIDGFEKAKEELAAEMDSKCYDQECGFSSHDIRHFGDEDIK